MHFGPAPLYGDAMTGLVSVDARGTACPVPILELAKVLRTAAPGQLVELRATDPAVERDVRAFCDATGNVLESFERRADELVAHVRRAPG